MTKHHSDLFKLTWKEPKKVFGNEDSSETDQE